MSVHKWQLVTWEEFFVEVVYITSSDRYFSNYLRLLMECLFSYRLLNNRRRFYLIGIWRLWFKLAWGFPISWLYGCTPFNFPLLSAHTEKNMQKPWIVWITISKGGAFSMVGGSLLFFRVFCNKNNNQLKLLLVAEYIEALMPSHNWGRGGYFHHIPWSDYVTISFILTPLVQADIKLTTY